MVVADMVFGCGRYRLTVADMVCGQYGRTPMQSNHLKLLAVVSVVAIVHPATCCLIFAVLA